MIQVIDFAFDIFSDVWSLILDHWLLSISVLLILINWVISLVKGSSQD